MLDDPTKCKYHKDKMCILDKSFCPAYSLICPDYETQNEKA